jgi:hypothetical protein
MDVAQVADELYGLAPAEFIAARDERAEAARSAGDRKLAVAISKLRKPTVSAWLVNQLPRHAGDDLGRLLELGEALREAQRTLAGDKLRELSRHRSTQVNALLQRARRLAAQAGQPVSAQMLRDVAASLEAAVADPDAAAAIQAGRLTNTLYHVGLGAEDPDLAGFGAQWAASAGGEGRRLRAVPDPAPEAPEPRGARSGAATARERGGTAARTRPGRAGAGDRPSRAKAGGKAAGGGAATAQRRPRETAEQRAAREEAAARDAAAAREAAAAERKAREVAAAERDVHEAEVLAEEASTALAEGEKQVASARTRRKSVKNRLEELEQALVTAQTDDAKAARELRDAQRSREAAAGSLSTAQRRVLRAKAKLDKLT